MSCHLTPMAPNEACRQAFEYQRRQALANGGRLVGEAVKLDGRTLILTFASGRSSEVVMPRADEAPAFPLRQNSHT